MIIVSESSAEATRRVRAGRSTPVHSRSSAAHNDTSRPLGRTANQRSHRGARRIEEVVSSGSRPEGRTHRGVNGLVRAALQVLGRPCRQARGG